MHETIVTIKALNKISILMSLNLGEFVQKYDPHHLHKKKKKKKIGALDFIGDKYICKYVNI